MGLMKRLRLLANLAWLTVCLLSGGLTTAVVWYWLSGPMWRVNADAGAVAAFSPDGRVLLSTVNTPVAKVCRWDVETGQLLGEAVFAEASIEPDNLYPSPDG